MTATRSRALLLAFLGLLLPVAARAQSPDAIRAAEQAREAGRYSEAAAILRREVTERSPLRDQLLLAETLAWAKQFEDAAETYRSIVARWPQSSEAQLGLGRVLLWMGEYGEAKASLRRAVELDRSNAAATLDLANASYWSGDWRNAERLYRDVLRLSPANTEARNALAAIHEATVPSLTIGATAVDDDQPYETIRGELTWDAPLDPLSRIAVSAGSYSLSTPELSERAPFASIRASTTLSSMPLSLTAEFRALQFPDGDTLPLGGIAASYRVSQHSAFTATIDRRELLATATSIDDHANVTAARLEWKRESERWRAAASASALRYFDDNEGAGADGWFLIRALNMSAMHLSVGASAAWRDTDEQRFFLQRSSAVAVAPSYFRYSYSAAYDPYWTPDDLREARVIGLLGFTLPRGAKATIQADWGRANDRTISFGPESGTDATPPVAPTIVSRTFEPWNVRADVAVPLGRDTSITASLQRMSTVFYEANFVSASISRRF